MSGDGCCTMLMGDFINSRLDGEAVRERPHRRDQRSREDEPLALRGIGHSIGDGFAGPLRAFSEACHEELKMY
jgi:hypothetical protein